MIFSEPLKCFRLKTVLKSLIDFHSTALLVEVRKLVPIQQMGRLSLSNLSRFAQQGGETEVFIPLLPLLLILIDLLILNWGLRAPGFIIH